MRRRLERRQLSQTLKLFALLKKRRNKQLVLPEEKEVEEDMAKYNLQAGGGDITKVRDHIVIVLVTKNMEMKLSIVRFHGKISQNERT